MRVLLPADSAPRQRGRGHTVIGLDVSPGKDTVVLGSVADRATIDRELAYDIDAVIRAGALHNPDMVRYPKQAFIEVNVTGTLNLLKAANAAGCDRFVFTSTTSLMAARCAPER